MAGSDTTDVKDDEDLNNMSVAELNSYLQQSKDAVKNLRSKISELMKPLKKGDSPLRVAAKDVEFFSTNFRQRNTLKGHYGKIYAMHWETSMGYGGGNQLVSASQDGKLMIWNAINTNKKLAIPLRSTWVMTCAYSPSSDFVACGGLDNLCSVYKTDAQSTGWDSIKPIAELQHHEGYLSCCRFVDDNQIITSSGDATCILWDIENNRVKANFMDHNSDVMSVSVQDSRGVFVSGSCDATAKIFDYRASKTCVGTFRGHDSDINAVQWFPDGYAFATGSDDSTIRLFDQRSYRQLNVYKHTDAICGVTSLDFSKTGKYIFAGYDDKPFAMVWDTLKGKDTQTLSNLTTRVSCLGVQSGGWALCTGSWDNILRIWA